jgi:hypothetical protein
MADLECHDHAGIYDPEAGLRRTNHAAPAVGGIATGGTAEQSPEWDRDAIAADVGRLPARRGLTERRAARLERRAVMRLLDERLPFEQLGSLTDRARLRDQVLADLAASRPERVAQARSQARTRGGGRCESV